MSEKPQQNIASDDEIDLLQLFSVLYARKFFIIFIALVAGFIGAVKALNTPPMYQADALLLIEEKSGGGLALSADISELIGGSNTATIDEVAILRSRMILGAVVDNLDLTRWAAPKRLPFAGQILARYDIPDPGWTFLSSYAWHDEEIKLGHLFIPENLREEILILTYQSEGLFVVTSDSGLEISGTVGQRMVDDATGIELLVDYLVAIPGRQFFIGQNARTDLISLLQGALSVSEPDWESSILALNLVYSDQEMSAKILNEILEVYLRQNLSRSVAEVEGSLDFVRSQLPEAQELVTAAEDALNVYKLSQESVDLTFETRALLEQAVQIETQLNALQLEEQELRKRFTESHPIYQTLLDNRQQLIDRLEGIRSQTSALPETQQIMLRLSQDLEVSQQIYLQLVNRAQELNVIKAGTIGNIRVIDAAVALPSPISPNRK